MNVSKKINTGLPKNLTKLIKTIGSAGDESGINVFLVGGFVRDFLLGAKNFDLDIVIEGDAVKFGKKLKKKIGGTLVSYKRFGTASLIKKWPAWLGAALNPDGKFKVDIAAARKETYKKPAALPDVKFSSLKEDLSRRDFTINAMAVSINKQDFGLLIDFFKGREDLKKGIVRTLHKKSFIDDPTRIFRAVRFEQRFGFRLERKTRDLIKNAVSEKMFQKTSKERLRNELVLILKEKNPEKAIFRMEQLHELRFIHPKLILRKSAGKLFSDLRKRLLWYKSYAADKRELNVWLMNFMIMTDSLTMRQIESVVKKLALTRGEKEYLLDYKARGGKALKRLSVKKRIASGDIYAILNQLTHEVMLVIMAKAVSSVASRRIKKFLAKYDRIKLRITGKDIKKEGIKPGPGYEKILREVLCEKLEGKLPTKRDEVRFMRTIISNLR